jgi:glycosyltransferase involved in cell wall biosynthesis
MASSLPEQLKTHPLVGYKPFLKLSKLLESWVIRQASYVICSGGLLAHVRSVHQDVKASEWWFPSVVTDGVRSETAKQFRKNLQLGPEERLFVYTGSFSSYQGISILLEAISRVDKSSVSARFLLAGATPEELRNIQGLWKSGFPGNVSVLGRVSREEVGKMLIASDALISPRLFGRNIPLKIFDYMGAGKPIIASNIPAHRAVLDESRAIFFENTTESLANAIIDLTQNQNKAALLSESSLVYAKKFLTWPRFRISIQLMVDKVQNIQRAQSYFESSDLAEDQEIMDTPNSFTVENTHEEIL